MHISLVSKVRGRRSFVFSTPELLSPEDAKEAQTQLGYHPCGYGHYNYQQTDQGTSWTCYDNCD